MRTRYLFAFVVVCFVVLASYFARLHVQQVEIDNNQRTLDAWKR